MQGINLCGKYIFTQRIPVNKENSKHILMNTELMGVFFGHSCIGTSNFTVHHNNEIPLPTSLLAAKISNSWDLETKNTMLT